VKIEVPREDSEGKMSQKKRNSLQESKIQAEVNELRDWGGSGGGVKAILLLLHSFFSTVKAGCSATHRRKGICHLMLDPEAIPEEMGFWRTDGGTPMKKTRMYGLHPWVAEKTTRSGQRGNDQREEAREIFMLFA